MIFREHTYSVLVVSSSEKLNTALKDLLPANTYWPVEPVEGIAEARRLTADRSFDLVVINISPQDHDGIRFSMDLSDRSDAGILLLCGSDLYDAVYDQVVDHGIAVLPKPVTPKMLSMTLRILCSSLEKQRRLAAKQATVDERMEEIRILNHAKWMLIEHMQMTEPEAHRYIERQAMDLRLPKRKVAENIIQSYA